MPTAKETGMGEGDERSGLSLQKGRERKQGSTVR